MERAPDVDRQVPAVVWAYGGLGLVPFAVGAVGALLAVGPARGLFQVGLLLYGGLILAFLGGGRFGMEVRRTGVRPGVVSGAMAGSILATLLIVAAGVPPAWRLVVLALAHGAQWAWDVRTVKTPAWYPRLRHVLAAGAVLALMVGAAASLR